MLLAGRSAAGKSTTISSLLLDHYRGAFENIYIFSSTVHLDPTFQALVRYGEQELHQGKTDDHAPIEFVYTTFDEGAMLEIMERSKLSLERQTREKKKIMRSSVIILDDLSHKGGIRKHQGGAIARLFTTARHHGLSVIAS
jgi:hypothetical protein